MKRRGDSNCLPFATRCEYCISELSLLPVKVYTCFHFYSSALGEQGVTSTRQVEMRERERDDDED